MINSHSVNRERRCLNSDTIPGARDSLRRDVESFLTFVHTQYARFVSQLVNVQYQLLICCPVPVVSQQFTCYAVLYAGRTIDVQCCIFTQKRSDDMVEPNHMIYMRMGYKEVTEFKYYFNSSPDPDPTLKQNSTTFIEKFDQKIRILYG